MSHSPSTTTTTDAVADRVARPSRAAPQRRRHSLTTRRQHRAAYLFILPFFVIFLTMLVVPLVYAGYLSLFESRLIGGEQFAGLANYARAFGDPNFWGGLGRVALFLLIQVPIMLGLALFFALALDTGRARGSRSIRLLIFMPYAVPAVIATLMWGYLYGPDFGPLAQVARGVGWGTPDFLSPGNILGSMMNIVTWEFIGYNMIIMYAALRAIPAELYEAAEIEGAGQFRIAWSIKIPSIRPAILLTVIFSVIGSFQLFNEPSILQSLAPNSISTYFTPNLYAYSLSFAGQQYNYSATVAIIMGVITMVIAYAVQLRGMRKES